jgi:hypothetical protein
VSPTLDGDMPSRRRIPVRFAHGSIVLTVPDAVVNALVFPAVLAPEDLVGLI